MPLDLFPYQRDGAIFLMRRDRAGLFDEMGTGKSATTIAALDAVAARRVLVICPAAVREVWRGELKKFAVRHRRIVAGRDIQDLNLWLKGKADVLLLSYEMATKWAPRLGGDIIDAIIFDECFRYHTMVETEIGPLPIGEIVEGRLPVKVWCQGKEKLELRSVTRYIKTRAYSGLIKIVHQGGSLVCTPNHKVFAEGRGYVEAQEIQAGDRLRMVRRPFYPATEGAEVLQPFMLGELAQSEPSNIACAHGEDGGCCDPGQDRQAAAGRIREDETPKFRSGVSRQSGRRIEVAERQELAGSARRQRLHHRTTADVMRGAELAGGLDGTLYSNSAGQESVREPATRLQSRLGVSVDQTSDRSGRPQSQHQALAFSGSEEDSRLKCIRVDRIEVYEQPSDDGTAVYNIEVDEHHNYIADGVLVGNCHYLKSPDSSRTKALLGQRCDGADGLARWGAYVWFLTGTPNPNDAADLWSMMRFCRATALEREKFCTRYYKKWQGSYSARHDPKTDMLGELKQAVSSFSIRRTKRQVGLQLPPIWLTTTTVDGDTDEIRGLLREHPGLEDAILEAVERGGLSFLDAQHIATLRRLVGEAKAPAFVNLLVEELHNGLEKVVIFGIHVRALDAIQEGLRRAHIRCVRFDGQTSERERRSAIESFQGDGDVRVFLGNIRAAGTGLTLTAAADVILFESDWSPAGNAQALMRVHRIGQERAVRARFITLAGSIDEHVSAVVARKIAAIARIEGQAEYGLTA